MPYALTPEVRVNTYIDSRQSAVQTVALRDGGYVTVWSGAGVGDQGYGIFLQRFDARGIRVGGELLVNTITANSQRNPQITLLADGGYAVIWDDTVPGQTGSLGLFGQTFDATGARVGANVHISPVGSSQEMTALPGGGYVATWTQPVDYPWSGVFARRIDAAGQPQGPAFALDTDIEAVVPSITATDFGFIAVWRAYNDGVATIAVQAFDASGARRGETIRIPRDGASTHPEIVRLADGGFALVWTQLDGLYGQILSDDGQPAGARFLIQGAPSSDSLLHTVVATPDGGFTVAWEHFRGLSQNSISVASFFADGGRNGDTLLVRGPGGTPGEPPSLAVLASGDVILSYSRYVGNVADYYDVFQVRLQRQDTSLNGSAAADALSGDAGADRILGHGGDDILYGLGGNDVLIGGAGNDRLDGGAGWDEAVFTGASDRYKVFEAADGTWNVRGPDGADLLTGVEQLRFDDKTIDLTRMICFPPAEAAPASPKPDVFPDTAFTLPPSPDWGW